MENKIETMPSAVPSELIVLGCMLVDSKAADEALEVLRESDFFVPIHHIIFRAMKSCRKKSRELGVVSVGEELAAMEVKVANDLPIVTYLTQCAQKAYIGLDVTTHLDIILEKKTRRDFIRTAEIIYQQSTCETNNLSLTLETCRQMLFKVDSRTTHDGGRSFSVLNKIERDLAIKESRDFRKTGIRLSRGIRTGFSDIDRLTDGLCPGNLCVIAGRPGMGKTALALNLLCNMSVNNKKAAAFFSLEMTSKEIVRRMMSISSQVDYSAIRNSVMDEAQIEELTKDSKKFDDVKIITYEDMTRTVTEMRRRCRRLKEKGELDIVFIDYLQLIRTEGKNYENRQVEVAEISRELKSLAIDLDVPVVCLAQLSRKIEERQSGVPVLSDLRESGSVEQDSDLVMFLAPTSTDLARKNHISLYLAKNRHGQTGKIDFIFNGSTLTFNQKTFSS